MYNLQNSLEDESTAGNISAVDRKDLQDIIDEALDWMEFNAGVEKDECLAKQKEIVSLVASPIRRSFYSGGGDDDDKDFGHDELYLKVLQVGV